MQSHTLTSNLFEPSNQVEFFLPNPLTQQLRIAILNNNEFQIQSLPFKNLQTLAMEIRNYLLVLNNPYNYHFLKTNILNQALTQLSKISLETSRPDKALDLYFTINSVFMICKHSSNLVTDLLNFLKARENFLRGDSLDYCFNLSLANQFCCQLIEILFPNNKHPINFLLFNARTQNRATEWEDLLTLEPNLESPGSFYRTQHNDIHLYSSLVNRAIVNLKKAFSKLEDVWLGADPRNLKPLTQQDLKLLSNRSPTIAALIDYVTQLSKGGLKAGNLLERFSNLRKGFLLGDLNHNGTESEAGIAAYLAAHSFLNWWHSLSRTEEGKELQNAIMNINKKMWAFIRRIVFEFDYCVNLGGGALDELLENAYVRDELERLSSEHIIRLSDYELDRIEEQILLELNTFRANNTDKNYFADFIKSSELMTAFNKHAADMTYQRLIANNVIARFQDKDKQKLHGFFSQFKYTIKKIKKEIKEEFKDKTISIPRIK